MRRVNELSMKLTGCEETDMWADCLSAGVNANVLQLVLLQAQAVRVGGQVQRLRQERLVRQQVEPRYLDWQGDFISGGMFMQNEENLKKALRIFFIFGFLHERLPMTNENKKLALMR
jgi:hypothetical protein